jgi:hypothetical protein
MSLLTFFKKCKAKFRKTICDFLSNLGLNLSHSKSESVLFSRKSSQLAPPLFIDKNPITISKQFKYLGVIFDRGLTWKAHVGYIQKRCRMRINFMKSIAGTTWGSHPDNMLLLYKGLVRTVLEYGCFCFAEMAETHIKKLERVQWRGLRIWMDGWISGGGGRRLPHAGHDLGLMCYPEGERNLDLNGDWKGDRKEK